MNGSWLRRVIRKTPILSDLSQMTHALWNIEAMLMRLKTMEAVHRSELTLSTLARYSDRLRLAAFSHQVNSQNGEDGIIREIFNRIGIVHRSFVEIGVGDGTENNTAFLLAQGWRGYWIDADDGFVSRLSSSAYRDSDKLRYAVAFVSRENVNELLGQLAVPAEFDLLSIDIDQNTYYAWEALEAFRPRVVAVEYNASIPPDLDWKVRYDSGRVWDGSRNFGASLKAYERLGERLGYSLVGCDFHGINAFFVRSDLVEGKFCAPFTAENHHEPPRYGYAGTAGHRRALLDPQADL
jgi:hypothetical protein